MDEFHIVDRGGGDLSRRLRAGNVSGDERGHPAAQRIVDTAGAAGGDG